MIFTAGLSLLTLYIPREPGYKTFLTGRRLLGCAYILLALANFMSCMTDFDSDILPIKQSITIIISSFQAFLFTFSFIALLQPSFVSFKKIGLQIIYICILGFILLGARKFIEFGAFKIVYLTGTICYFCQCVYYVYLFKSHVIQYKNENTEISSYQTKRIQWINHTFFLTLCIGMLALFFFILHIWFLIFFTVVYTLFYVYFAVKYINYGIIFRKVHISLIKTDDSVSRRDINQIDISERVLQWIENKKYIRKNLTMEKVALEMSTNRTYLSRYLNQDLNKTFNDWIRELRIEEAKLLLKEQPELSFIEVGEKVGIPDKGSFYRQFSSITGETPGSYKKKIT